MIVRQTTIAMKLVKCMVLFSMTKENYSKKPKVLIDEIMNLKI